MCIQTQRIVCALLFCILCWGNSFTRFAFADQPTPILSQSKAPWRSVNWATLYHDPNLEHQDFLKIKWKQLEDILNRISDSKVSFNKDSQERDKDARASLICSDWLQFKSYLSLNYDRNKHSILNRKIKREDLCPKLDHFVKSYLNAKLSLVFISASLLSPASAFGHLILSIELPKTNEQILERSIAFSFSVPHVQGFAHGLKLLFLDDQGTYLFDDLLKVLQHYQSSEQRNLWSYPLKLSAQQKDRLLTELWSLIQQSNTHKPTGKVIDPRTRYSFAGGNCSSKLALILANAMQEFSIYQNFAWPHAPQELIQNLQELGLLAQPIFMPAKSTRVRAYLSLKALLKSIDLPPDSLTDQDTLKRIDAELGLAQLSLSENYSAQSSSKSAKQSSHQSSSEQYLKQLALYASLPQTPQASARLSPLNLTALSPRPAPEHSLSYAKVNWGIDVFSKQSDLSLSHFNILSARWKGQDFSDQSTAYALSSHAWTLGAVSLHTPLNLDSDHQSNLDLDHLWKSSFTRWTLIDYKQRAITHIPSWTWDFNLAYQAKPHFHLRFGHSWASAIKVYESTGFNVSRSIKQNKYDQQAHLDDSRLFNWFPANSTQEVDLAEPSLASHWLGAVLFGLGYNKSCSLQACRSPLRFQAVAHLLTNILSHNKLLVLMELESQLTLGLYDTYQEFIANEQALSVLPKSFSQLWQQEHTLKLSMRYTGTQRALKPYTLSFYSSYQSSVLPIERKDWLLSTGLTLSWNY